MGSRKDKRSTPAAVTRKAHHLIREEGKEPDVAFGMAYGMKRSGRLTKTGGYIKGKRK